MSTTSTTYTKNRKRRGRREDEVKRTSSNVTSGSRGYYTDGNGRLQNKNGKWSSNKLKHEISSFIAEFSYLNDTKNKSQNNPTLKEQSNANTPQQNVQVYAVRRDEQMITPFEDPELRRKGVEWEDHRGGTMVYNVQDTTCQRKQSRGRAIRHIGLRHRPKMTVKKSCPRKCSTSRDLSCPIRAKSNKRIRRRFSGFRASKSNSRKGRSRSCRSLTPMRMRRRVRSQVRKRSRSRSPSCSTSQIRDIPLHFRHRRTREIVIKRSKPKITYKTIEPCAEPTLVTLFPRPPRTVIYRPKQRRLPSRPEPELPCKCEMCKNKYRSLTRLYGEPCFNPCGPPCPPVCAPCPPVCNPCPPICAPCPPMCSPCPPKCQVVRRDCSPCSPRRDYSPCSPNWCCNKGRMSCNRPWANQCCTDDCCQPQLTSRCVNSICFKYRAVGQCNSNITHYFHSILDRRACCY